MGFVAYYLNDENHFAYVPQVVVHKEARHKGLGHSMFKVLCDSLTSNIKCIKLEVLKSNFYVRNFYQRDGFSCVEDHSERILLEKIMTECERIISLGRLPGDFLKEEIRCGFHVDTLRKKVWAIELDIYMKFVEVCKKHNLKFWGDGGTLLGALEECGKWHPDVIWNPDVPYTELLKKLLMKVY